MNYNTKARIEARIKRAQAILLVIAIILAGLAALKTESHAEDAATAWVICQPGDYVIIREGPSRKSAAVGRLDSGDEIRVDGVTKNGYARLSGMVIDAVEAWVYTGYIVFDEPRWSGESRIVTGGRRIAARKNCAGEIRKWLKRGTQVQVFWWSDEWCVTNRGFIRTEFLEVEGI